MFEFGRCSGLKPPGRELKALSTHAYLDLRRMFLIENNTVF